MRKHRHRYKVVRSIWPYKAGWGVACSVCGSIVDTGISKEGAEIIAKNLNAQKIRGRG